MINFTLPQLLLSRGFHTTTVLFIQASHPLIGKVDWELIASGQYCVVDPMNKGSVLHVSYQDYLVLVRVAMSNNTTLTVLAAPGDTAPQARKSPSSTPLKPAKGFISPNDPESQNSPPLNDNQFNHLLQDFFFPKKALSNLSSSRVRLGSATKALLQSPLCNFAEVSETGTLMIKLTVRNIGKWLRQWHDNLHWWSRNTVPGIVTKLEVQAFGMTLQDLLKTRGINDLILRLKISLFVVNAYLGGRRMTSTADLGVRIRLVNGLPAFLPARVRNGIRYGNLHYIHIWTSVLNSYKGIKGIWYEPNLAQGSIAQPHPQIELTILRQLSIFARIFWRQVRNRYGLRPISFHVRAPFFSIKAGPNSPNTILGAGIDAFLWYALDRKVPAKPGSRDIMVPDPKLPQIQEVLGVKHNLIRLWLEATGQKALERQIRMTAKMFAMQFRLHNLITGKWYEFLGQLRSPKSLLTGSQVSWGRYAKENFITRFNSAEDFFQTILGANNALLRYSMPTLSKLHNLCEPAGKVRTIAIVDYWTNFVLKPLHDWMFDLLKCLPQDATFDQEGRVEEFASRGYKEVYSYDLKSATDLIPLALYKWCFGHIIPRGILEVWLRLLVDREFRVPSGVLRAHPGHPITVRYNTGQPMGALTSWAAMAILHHILVLFSSFLAGKTTLWTILDFIDYLVLGDDVVIADAQVAQAYVRLCNRLHIPIGLAKSHISALGMFNFANQTFVNHVNVSPVSMKEELNAKGLLARIAFIMRMSRRGWKDMESRKWFSNLLRGLTNSKIWFDAVAPLAGKRRTTPILHWIVASVLLPGTSRLGYTGLSVDPRLLISTYVRKSRLWTTTLRDLKDTILSIPEQSLLSLFTARWADSIYQQFLSNRKRLAEFKSWVTRIISVDIEWLFLLIFEEGRSQANEKWAKKFRIPVKEIQVASKIPGISTIDLIERATGMSLDELFKLLEDAEKALPLIPDFEPSTLSAILPDKGEEGMPARDAALKRAQYRSMLQIASLLIMLEQLPHSPNNPGTVLGRNETSSQRLDSFFKELAKR